jgi:biuret amidohydrolase
MNTALICIDFVNDIVSEGGKLAGKGYGTFASDHQVLKTLGEAQSQARALSVPVIHVRVGFDSAYLSQPKASPLFGKAHQAGALELGSWGTEYALGVGPDEGELSINKPRVSAFWGSSLEPSLRTLGVSKVHLAGVATDLAVLASALDAHDRDFEVSVVKDACAAASDADHERAILILGKVAAVTTVEDLFAK